MQYIGFGTHGQRNLTFYLLVNNYFRINDLSICIIVQFNNIMMDNRQWRPMQNNYYSDSQNNISNVSVYSDNSIHLYRYGIS